MPDKEVTIAVHTAEIRELREQLEKVQADVVSLKATLQKYHGFIGGVIFIVSGIWLFLTQAKDIVTWFRG